VSEVRLPGRLEVAGERLAETLPDLAVVLLFDGFMVLAVLIGATAGQWLWHRHLDPSALLGAAVGSALGTTIVAIGYRQVEKYSTKARR
jgi:purine-cytosine permease-like protein